MRKPTIAVLAFLALALAVPQFITNPYYLHILIIIGINIIGAIGLQLVMRVGEVTFGHAAFMGIGAYTAAILAKHFGLSFWLILPLAALVPALFALAIGPVLFRVTRTYFFLASFALGEMILIIFGHVREDLFGGAGGIAGIPAPNPITLFGMTIDFFDKGTYYYLVLIILVLTLLVVRYLYNSYLGKIFSSLKEQDVLVRSVGIDSRMYKTAALSIACFFAGIAGALYAHYIFFVNPVGFGVMKSMEFLIFVMVGGRESMSGLVLATTLLTFLPELLAFTKEIRPIFFGGCLILVLMFMPRGISGVAPRITALQRRFQRRGASGENP